MILKILLQKLADLFKNYESGRKQPSGYSQVFSSLYYGVVDNTVVNKQLKQAKVAESTVMEKSLRALADNKEHVCDITTILQAKKLLQEHVEKIKSIRERYDEAGATYDGILKVCLVVIDKIISYYNMSGLKDKKEEEVANDPRCILENHLLDFLIDAEIKVAMDERNNEAGLIDKLITKVRITIELVIPNFLKEVQNTEPRYYMLVESIIKQALSDKIFAGNTKIAALLAKSLNDAQTKIKSLPKYSAMQRALNEETSSRRVAAQAETLRQICECFTAAEDKIVGKGNSTYILVRSRSPKQNDASTGDSKSSVEANSPSNAGTTSDRSSAEANNSNNASSTSSTSNTSNTRANYTQAQALETKTPNAEAATASAASTTATKATTATTATTTASLSSATTTLTTAFANAVASASVASSTSTATSTSASVASSTSTATSTSASTVTTTSASSATSTSASTSVDAASLAPEHLTHTPQTPLYVDVAKSNAVRSGNGSPHASPVPSTNRPSGGRFSAQNSPVPPAKRPNGGNGGRSPQISPVPPAKRAASGRSPNVFPEPPANSLNPSVLFLASTSTSAESSFSTVSSQASVQPQQAAPQSQPVSQPQPPQPQQQPRAIAQQPVVSPTSVASQPPARPRQGNNKAANGVNLRSG